MEDLKMNLDIDKELFTPLSEEEWDILIMIQI